MHSKVQEEVVGDGPTAELIGRCLLQGRSRILFGPVKYFYTFPSSKLKLCDQNLNMSSMKFQHPYPPIIMGFVHNNIRIEQYLILVKQFYPNKIRQHQLFRVIISSKFIYGYIQIRQNYSWIIFYIYMNSPSQIRI